MRVTASQLLNYVQHIVDTEGEDCPIYYQLFTPKDVEIYEYDSELDREFREEVLDALNDREILTDAVFHIMSDEIQVKLNEYLDSEDDY